MQDYRPIHRAVRFFQDLNAADDIVMATAHVHGDDEPVATPVAELAPRQPVTGAPVEYATVGGKAGDGLSRPPGRSA